MTNKSKIDGNREIARFYFKDDPSINQSRIGECYFTYHKDWNELMLVVEKINKTKVGKEEFDVIIYQTSCHINDKEQIIIEKSYYSSLIQCVWDAVFEFCKLYNNKKLNPCTQ